MPEAIGEGSDVVKIIRNSKRHENRNYSPLFNEDFVEQVKKRGFSSHPSKSELLNFIDSTELKPEDIQRLQKVFGAPRFYESAQWFDEQLRHGDLKGIFNPSERYFFYRGYLGTAIVLHNILKSCRAIVHHAKKKNHREGEPIGYISYLYKRYRVREPYESFAAAFTAMATHEPSLATLVEQMRLIITTKSIKKKKVVATYSLLDELRREAIYLAASRLSTKTAVDDTFFSHLSAETLGALVRIYGALPPNKLSALTREHQKVITALSKAHSKKFTEQKELQKFLFKNVRPVLDK